MSIGIGNGGSKKARHRLDLRRLAVRLGIAALIVCGRDGHGKTLEEVLKEKGVITEADFKEVTAAKPLAYQVGKGFTFTSPDGRFQVDLAKSGTAQMLEDAYVNYRFVEAARILAEVLATVVMTTHDPDHPARLEGEVIVLDRGRVAFAGTAPGPPWPREERGRALL